MNASRNAGFSMIEVMVTIVILMVGLLGLAGMQGKAMTTQMESYQRSQALILLKDMVDRINANRGAAADYQTAGVGTWATAGCPAAGTTPTRASIDLNEWCSALLGAAETSGAGNVGAMIGAWGCITQTAAPATGVPSQYQVAVAWQGLNSTATPSIACGAGKYGTDDSKRRVVALTVSIADLN